MEHLQEKVSAEQVLVLVRDPAMVADLSARGVQVREADFNQPETLAELATEVSR
jgi:NAD(P)H dehydrogenase (quinone)